MIGYWPPIPPAPIPIVYVYPTTTAFTATPASYGDGNSYGTTTGYYSPANIPRERDELEEKVEVFARKAAAEAARHRAAMRRHLKALRADSAWHSAPRLPALGFRDPLAGHRGARRRAPRRSWLQRSST